MRPFRLTAASGHRPVAASRTATVTINPGTHTIVKVNQSQSLHIVQTTITASLSAILYIRDLFPENFFEHRTYSLASPDFPFTVTGTDTSSKKKQLNDAKSVTWDMLVRGKHKHADKILSWLDGVGEALKHKYLESFVISFHNDGRVAPDTVAEAYVLNFSYSGPEKEPHVNLVAKNETVGLTVKDLADLKSLYKRLVTLASNSVSTLQEAPMIGMQLTYNDTCPKEYEPPGFQSAPADRVINELGGVEVGSMDTKYHQMNVRLLSPFEVPATPPNNSAVRNTRIEELSQQQQQSPASSEVMDTQDRNTKRLIKAMLPPVTKVEDTQPADTSAAQREAGDKPTDASTCTLEDLVSRTFVFEDMWLATDQRDVVETVPGSKECFCGKDFDDVSMSCQKCKTPQHRKCYGYLDGDILRGGFLCYECLFPDSQPLADLEELCRTRSILKSILDLGYPSLENQLAKRTGYLVKDIKAVTNVLREEGYLVKNYRPNEKKGKAFRKSPLGPAFSIEKGKRADMVTTYFDPRKCIEQYLVMVEATKSTGLDATSPFITPTPMPASSKAIKPQVFAKTAHSHKEQGISGGKNLSNAVATAKHQISKIQMLAAAGTSKQSRWDVLDIDSDEDVDSDSATDMTMERKASIRDPRKSSQDLTASSPKRGVKRPATQLERENGSKKQSFLRSPMPVHYLDKKQR